MSGTLMNFSLFGGPGDGALVAHALLGPEERYLVRMPEVDGRKWVLASRFANRTEAGGPWVLEFERVVGFQGLGGACHE